jgi:hypothetical protein
MTNAGLLSKLFACACLQMLLDATLPAAQPTHLDISFPTLPNAEDPSILDICATV